MNDRELMQQALDALIRYEIGVDGEWGDCRSMGQIDADGDTPPIITALRERLAQPEQEPVGKFAQFTDGIWREVTDGSAGVPLYTTPPQRQWIGLTVDELITLEQKHMRHEDLSQAIEQALKEKNT